MPHTKDAIKAVLHQEQEPEHKEHKDKLAQNKLNERDIKESLKEKRDKDKEIKHEAQKAESKAFKEERALNHVLNPHDPVSKLAAKEAREEKREEKEAGRV